MSLALKILAALVLYTLAVQYVGAFIRAGDSTDEPKCPTCGGTGTQDSDVLDSNACPDCHLDI